MVARKPLPHSYSPTSMRGPAAVDDVPASLRPGGNRIQNQNQASPASSDAYSSFEAEEQSVWRQQPQQQPQQQQPPPQPPQPQPPIPKIVLRTATGSSTASAFSDTNPFKRKVLDTDLYTASPIAAPSSVNLPPPSTAPPPPPSPPQQQQQQQQQQPPTASFAQIGVVDDQQSAQNPWQQSAGTSSDRRAFSASSASSAAPLPTIFDASETTGAVDENAWAAASSTSGAPPSTTTTRPVPAASSSSFRNSNLISFPSDDEVTVGPDWTDVAPPSHPPPPAAASGAAAAAAPPPRPPFTPLGDKEAETLVYEGSHAWDDVSGRIAAKPPPVPLVPDETGGGWSMADDSEPVLVQLSRQSSWENFTDDEDEQSEASKPAGASQAAADASSSSQAAAAPDTGSGKAKGKAVASAGSVAAPASGLLIDIDSPDQPSSSRLLSSAPAAPAAPASPSPSHQTPQTTASSAEAPRPQLPPRSMLDVDSVPPPSQPPPPPSRSSADASKTTETYPIKLITWHDPRTAQNPRVSPILVQNANGPCPLVALVNALTLTTPADTTAALVEALRTREQVSLDLLLDNVFDELMSPRRSSSDSSLPDVDELYAFLKGLHTGMNVNPRYIPTAEAVADNDTNPIPGTFENTREMQLYATFGIPLIHGWLPSTAEPAYDALKRQAASYEDVQNLLFREEELEQKLTSVGGLTVPEQALYQDILEIKTFLHVYATQLTPHGLGLLSKAMRPGTFAILFRNDHFSTLYLHPDTRQLLSLVTDAGYASHDEVVWESLVDVNGEHTEYFSGDFRLVGGGGSTNAHHHRGGSGSASQSAGGPSSAAADAAAAAAAAGSLCTEEEALSRHEQEDRDLALALQLQEEEEAQQREAEARRQTRLSEQYIDQNGRLAQAPTSAPAPSNAAGGGRYSSSSSSPASRNHLSQQHPSSAAAAAGSSAAPRRSSAGVYANSNSSNARLAAAAAGRGGGGSTASLGHHPRASSSSSASASASASSPNGRRPGAAAQQVVRPLVPPATTTTATSTVGATRIVGGRPAVHRPAAAGTGTGDDETDAPPSYEHAAMQAPYHPPPGAPGSETATLAATTSNTSTTTTGASRRPSPAVGAAGAASPAPSPNPAYQQQQQQQGLPRPPQGNMAYASTPGGQPYNTVPGRYGPQSNNYPGNRQDRDCLIM